MILGGIWAGYFPGRSGGGVVTTSSGSGPDLREMSPICPGNVPTSSPPFPFPLAFPGGLPPWAACART